MKTVMMSKLFKITALALFVMQITFLAITEKWDGLGTIRHFQYFTVQSNVMVILYLFLHDTKIFSLLRNMILGMIFLTFFIFWSVIFPFELLNYNMGILDIISEMIVHLINPALMVIYWHRSAKRYVCPKWTIALLPIYGVVYMIATQIIADNLTGFIPYIFIDIRQLGLVIFTAFFFTLLISFTVTSYVIWSINRKLYVKYDGQDKYLSR